MSDKHYEAVHGFNLGDGDEQRFEAGSKVAAGLLPDKTEKELVKAGVLKPLRARGGRS